MSMKIFISGSMTFKHLPGKVKEYIEREVLSPENEILVGDAPGIDRLVQEFCRKKNFFNVTVYSIFDKPRNKLCEEFGFKKVSTTGIKKEREAQRKKDRIMTQECDKSLVVWDGKSKGSYENIKRSIECKKDVKVYVYMSKYIYESLPDDFKNRGDFKNHDFIENVNDIDRIFLESNGYSAQELFRLFKGNREFGRRFKKSSDLYGYLCEKGLIAEVTRNEEVEKKRKLYKPADSGAKKYFIVTKYKGMPTGIRFRPAFVDWLKEELDRKKKKRAMPVQTEMVFPSPPDELGSSHENVSQM